MYWIDINLLSDREDSVADFAPAPSVVQDSKIPMALGLGVGAAAIAIVFGAYSVVGYFNQKLAAEEQELDQAISRLGPQLAQVEELETELSTIQGQTNALATIFNQIKPWSAMLTDLRNRVPASIQIKKIVQSGSGSNGGSQLSLDGSAISFGDVNDFVLTLRESNYLSETGADTRLKQASRRESKDGEGLVNYNIDTTINNVPADALLTALRQNGASGLVSRIETLKRQGVIRK
ncbi:MAG: PilN domain-containing protein [Cyanobacteria bacterium P01_F01_bin.42]